MIMHRRSGAAQQTGQWMPEASIFWNDCEKPRKLCERVRLGCVSYPKERILVFPVTSFTLGDRLRIVLQPTFHTNRKFYIRLKNGNDVVLSFEAHTLENENDATYSPHVFFNTFHNGAWETEEQTAGRCPLIWYRTYCIDFSPSGHHTVYVSAVRNKLADFRAASAVDSA
ncbi:hypothetical protein Y032_0009g796 [Ancylostoma ceylanicum]|uniref:Galectin domain-containing protein n=2 Tax=Ancylostoma ceylanicum TaxID=53326 RepID=A0A016VJX7_9BILA|nr:hypothetical protein Y032_0009g796 [Ancylostoma ceylanicum]